MLEITRGSLFDAEVEALVNPVNTVGVMGKGLALQFRKAFPDNFEAYKRECDAGRLHTGNVFVFQVSGDQNPRYIVNFPTKEHWRGDSQIDYVRDGLKALVADIQRLGIGSIAIPALGCGLGELRWDDIRPLVADAFRELPNVRAYLYEPAGA